MESLNSYCFPPIFSNLSLADCFHLRRVSRRLKAEIDDYLPAVQSVSLYLTTVWPPEMIYEYEKMLIGGLVFIDDYSPEMISEKMNYCLEHIYYNLSYPDCVRRLPFGTSGLNIIEDGTILQHQSHFRLEDFLIINSTDSLSKFLSFSRKYFPKITKLAIVFDHFEHYQSHFSSILSSFPAVKVLLIERTIQDSCRHLDQSDILEEFPLYHSLQNPRNQLVLSEEFYDSILSLYNLEELFFFSKRQSVLTIGQLRREYSRKFVMRMLKKLRVFHMNSRHCFRHFFHISISVEEIPEEGFQQLEELGCDDFHWLLSDRHVFPSLKKLIATQSYTSIWDPRQNRLNDEWIYCLQPTIRHIDCSLDKVSILCILLSYKN